MADQEMVSKDAQKTVVAFIAGLLIGGLLMWVFAGPGDDTMMNNEADDESADETDNVVSRTNTFTTSTNKTTSPSTSTSKPETGTSNVVVKNQSAGKVVVLSSVMFPSDEGWIGVRDYQNGQLGGLLGVARFSAEQGLSPSQIELLRSTAPGNDYAIVFYSESGDRQFSLANDVQMKGEPIIFSAK